MTMSVRVRFSQDRPGVTYVPPNENVDSFVKDILAKPMPPLHKEDNFEMDPFTASSIGDANVLQNLQMKKSFNPNQKNSSDWTPLLYAAYLGHHAVCSFLIDAGAKLDDCNRRGQTALMLASACGNLQVVRLLLERGASCDRSDGYDRQALHYAASCSQNVVVDALLLAGADPNAKDGEGMTPLLEACASGHELTAISLIEKSGDPSIRNCRGEDGSMLAAESPKILQLIKEKKQDQFLRGIMIEHSRHTRQPRTLAELLDAMNLSRLTARFEAENIDLKLFFDLNEKDFEEMGIAYGPKKRMLTVIDRYCKTGVLSMETFDTTNLDNIAAPSQYQATTSDDIIIRDLLTTVRHVRDVNESNKQLAMDALDAIRQNFNIELIRSLLTAIIEGAEKITTRVARHDV